MGAIICDFGRNDEGLFLYRVNGDKNEIEKYVGDLKELGCEVYPYELESSHKQYSVLLRIKFPPEVEEKMEKERAELDERIAESNAERDRIQGRNKKKPAIEIKDLKVEIED